MSGIGHYDATAWFLFRTDAIKIAGGCCERCSRPAGNGTVLQIHHKEYIRGHKPWEYEHSNCEVLCKGCHAKEHGKIQPTSDWILVGEDDLEEPSGTCDNCGTEIRYVFFIEHPKWNSMAVGTKCCDHLTESEHATSRKKHLEKRMRFMNSRRWGLNSNYGLHMSNNGILIQIQNLGENFQIVANGFHGQMRFASEVEAKIEVFEKLKTGQIQRYIQKQQNKRKNSTF